MAFNLIFILMIISIIESNNGQKLLKTIPSHIRNSEIGEYCEYNTDCIDFHGLCVDKKCNCKANYKLKNGKCEHFSCGFDSDCQEYDSNRGCDSTYGQCVCKIGFNEHHYNQKCNHYCSDHSDCGANQLCTEKQCKCKPNYQLDMTTKFCTYFLCHKNSDCWGIDNRRVCTNGQCNCDKYYIENYETMKCVVGGNGNSWVWFAVAFICVVMVLVVYYVRRRRFRDGFVRVPQSV